LQLEERLFLSVAAVATAIAAVPLDVPAQ